PEDNSGFVVDAGLRVQGGGYIRSLYNYTMPPPHGKYSFRLYFRGEYGQGRLNYPWFPNTTVDSFDTVVLRAGQNDNTNPYLRDELARQLASDVGQPASHGTFVNLFLNGVYKGYYNPTERIETEFLQAYHGGVNAWDVIGSVSELRDGDLVAWSQLMSLVQNRPATNNSNYLAIASRLDMVNFVDYLLVPIYADTDDWPHNNWRAARERVPGGKIRFYVWDAEQSFGVAHDYNYNTINGQLSNTSPPWGAPEIATIFNSLKRHPEFKQIFADRVHKHFFNGGALTDANIRRTYNLLKDVIAPSISGFDDSIGANWIPNRRSPLLTHLRAAGFLASTNAPGLNRFGGFVPSGFQLIMTNLFGTIYFTTNGEDPRTPITGAVADGSSTYTQPLTLTTPMVLRARSLSGTNWSALTETSFSIGGLGIPLRIGEIMYHPADDEAFEFVELINTGGRPLDVSGFGFNGIDFRFGTPSPTVKPGERIVIASDANTNAFRSYYPNVIVSGWFGGSLNNAGERLTLTDPNGLWIDSVPFNDKLPWPTEADGAGASLERMDVWAPSDLPDSWHASFKLGGTPGLPPSLPVSSGIQLREVFPGSEERVGWIELFNPGSSSVPLNGWRLREERQRAAFVFPSSVAIAPQEFLIVYCDTNPGHPGLHSGFKLDPTGGTVTLTDASNRRQDVVTFASLPSGRSLGRTGAFGTWELCEPSPAAPNEPVPLSSPSGLVLNEFLANSDQGYDWIEIHNSTNAPISLVGCYLATSNNVFRIASPIFAPPGGFVVLRADEEPGIDHLPFKLPSTPGMIALHDPSGALVSRVSYGSQLSSVATGRLPDGMGSWMSFPFSASPGRSNYIATLGSALRFNEIMAAAAEGTSGDWIELFNAGTSTIALDGYSITLESPSFSGWRFPDGITISPGSYQIIDCTPRASSPGRLDIGQELSDFSGALSLRDAQGRVIDRIRYGFQISNRTIGRANNEWRLLNSPSPGAVNTGAATLGDLRFVRFNEWLSAGWQGEDWFELFNPGSNAVNLAGCFLSDDPSLGGVSNALISPLTFIPAQGFVRFFADDSTERGSHHLPFRLDMLGETLRLYSPTRTVVESIDLLVQQPGVSEGLFPDGSTNVVRFPGTATPGASNRRFIDTDADGMPDDWEMANGFDPGEPSTAVQDTDGDGLNNLDEYRSDTDPRNPASALRLSVSQISESGIRLSFRAAAGRSYQIQSKDSLADVGWRLLKAISPSGEPREVTVREDRQAPEIKARFYRVVLE
ncbi:MAG: hypothetical protein FJ405_13450, partial [Verrucomicrobia bacterium]|nr:hypothetical protein [Verrucomicrobiota bacterium]